MNSELGLDLNGARLVMRNQAKKQLFTPSFLKFQLKDDIEYDFYFLLFSYPKFKFINLTQLRFDFIRHSE